MSWTNYDQWKQAEPVTYEIEEPTIKCDLCEEVTEDFKTVNITASLAILVCQDCYNSDPVDYQDALEFYQTKHIKS